jgi:hypothetical protein
MLAVGEAVAEQHLLLVAMVDLVAVAFQVAEEVPQQAQQELAQAVMVGLELLVVVVELVAHLERVMVEAVATVLTSLRV